MEKDGKSILLSRHYSKPCLKLNLVKKVQTITNLKYASLLARIRRPEREQKTSQHFLFLFSILWGARDA